MQALRALGAVICLSVIGAGGAVQANGMCPYDDQGPLGCPPGTVWVARLEVCLTPDQLMS